MTIRLKLDELLTKTGKTAKEVSAATGITEAALSEWRNNKVSRIDRRTLKTLCEYFDVPVSALVEYQAD